MPNLRETYGCGLPGKSARAEKTVPLAINTAGPGDQLLVDILISGMIAKGWLKLNSATKSDRCRCEVCNRYGRVRYASDAVAILNRRPEGVVRQRVEELRDHSKVIPLKQPEALWGRKETQWLSVDCTTRPANCE